MQTAFFLALKNGASIRHEPLFGNPWLALLAILACTAVLMIAVALFGKWLAATHPAPAPKPIVPTEEPEELDRAINAPTPQVLAVISTAVMATVGKRAHIVGIQTLHPQSVENLILFFTDAATTEIYTSHRLR